MEAVTAEVLAARLAAVERRLRLSTFVWLGIVIVLTVVSFGAQRALSQTSALHARSLDIVDASGRTRISLGLNTNGAPGIWVYDAHSKSRVYVGLSAQAAPAIELEDKSEKIRVYLGLGAGEGSAPELSLTDPRGDQRLYVGWSTTEKPLFSVYGADGKTLWSSP